MRCSTKESRTFFKKSGSEPVFEAISLTLKILQSLNRWAGDTEFELSMSAVNLSKKLNQELCKALRDKALRLVV
jgi:hypothetical protein